MNSGYILVEIYRKNISPDELIQELLIKGRTAIIYGDSNSGKTFFSLSLARDVSMGWSCYGRQTEKCHVLYLAVESPDSIQERIQAMKNYHNCDIDDIILTTRPINFFEKPESYHRVIDLVSALEKKINAKIGFILVDTLAQISAGANENSTEDMAPIMQKFEIIAKKTNAAVLVIHHSGKDKTKGARGSSSIYAHIDTEINVINEGGNKTAMVTKQRALGSKGDEIPYKLEIIEMGIGKFGDTKSTCVAIGDNDERVKRTDKKTSIIISNLEKAWLSSKQEMKHNGDGELLPYIASSVWSDHLVENNIYTRGSASQTVKPSHKGGNAQKMIEDKYIEKLGQGYIIIDMVLSSILVTKMEVI